MYDLFNRENFVKIRCSFLNPQCSCSFYLYNLFIELKYKNLNAYTGDRCITPLRKYALAQSASFFQMWGMCGMKIISKCFCKAVGLKNLKKLKCLHDAWWQWKAKESDKEYQNKIIAGLFFYLFKIQHHRQSS